MPAFSTDNTLNDNSDNRPEGTLRDAVMSWLAILFVAVLATIILRWDLLKQVSGTEAQATIVVLACLWVPFVIEAAAGFITSPRTKPYIQRLLLISLLPPFRLGLSTAVPWHRIWLPFTGWRDSNEILFKELEHKATVPMLIIALMILPVLGFELVLKENITQWPTLNLTLHIATAVIWFAFVIEFVVLMCVTDRKLKFCKKNWLNVLIILLPLLAFLRSLKVVRAFRAAKAVKLLRVYRMRSLAIKIWRSLIALNAIERLLERNPKKRLVQLRELEQDKLEELEEIQAKIEKLERVVSENE